MDPFDSKLPSLVVDSEEKFSVKHLEEDSQKVETLGNETSVKKSMKIQTKALRRLMGERIVADNVHKTNPGQKSKQQ